IASLFERAFHHYRRIFVGARAMKGGLGEAALATPKITFADQQALAKQRADNEFRQRAFVQFGMIEDEELLDVVGAIDEHPAHAHDRHADDVAVLASETLQCAEGIAADFERETEDWQAFGARRRVGSVIRHFGGASSFHPGVIRNVKPTEDAVDDHPKDRVVNAPGQCYGEHAAESPDADTSRAPVATVAHWGSPCARNRAEPV